MNWFLQLLAKWFPKTTVIPMPSTDNKILEVPVITKPPMTPQETLYQAAKNSLGKHMKLDSSVPNLFGCASSLSGVLKLAGVPELPPGGIGGTSALYDWLIRSPHFKIAAYGRGNIIMSQSGVLGAFLAHGHVGICGDHGIMSNDSDTGEWLEKWDEQKWTDYYHTYGKLPITYFEYISG